MGSGLPKSIKIGTEEVEAAISKHVDQIIEAIRASLEEIEPEVAADILKQEYIYLVVEQK